MNVVLPIEMMVFSAAAVNAMLLFAPAWTVAPVKYKFRDPEVCMPENRKL